MKPKWLPDANGKWLDINPIWVDGWSTQSEALCEAPVLIQGTSWPNSKLGLFAHQVDETSYMYMEIVL